jgi:HK97 family phage prohead protease
MLSKQTEYRSVKFETRAETTENGKKLILRGYPILFNTETTIFDWEYGEVKEVVLPTALNETRMDDVYMLLGHDINPTMVLGRAGKNMRLEIDETGLFVELELPNTQTARDIYNLIEAGIVDGMSFGFRCEDGVNPETKIRTITHISELYEVSITPFPAYKEACIIAKTRNDATNGIDAETEEKEEATMETQETEEATREETENKNAKLLEDILND